MTGTILNAVVRKLATGTVQCRHLISDDGITTRCFTMDKLSGIYEGISIDADLSKKNIHCLYNTFGIAKNLDEYQLKICVKLSSLPDTDPIKLGLQKFRIGIIASFTLLTVMLKTTNPADSLENWNFFANKLLRKASEFVSNLEPERVQTDSQNVDAYSEEAFNFFQVPLKEVETAMKEVYAY